MIVALKWVRRKPLAEEIQQSDETLAEHITKIMPSEHATDWQSLKSPLLAYQRVAQGLKSKSLSMCSLLLEKVFRNGLWIHFMRTACAGCDKKIHYGYIRCISIIFYRQQYFTAIHCFFDDWDLRCPIRIE